MFTRKTKYSPGEIVKYNDLEGYTSFGVVLHYTTDPDYEHYVMGVFNEPSGNGKTRSSIVKDLTVMGRLSVLNCISELISEEQFNKLKKPVYTYDFINQSNIVKSLPFKQQLQYIELYD